MEHVDIPAGEIHAPFQWLPADSAARLAIVPNASDVHKLALQLDDRSQWLLVDESPATWEQQAAQGPQGEPGPQGDPGEQGPQGDPGDPATNLVTSVAGKTGVVTLVKADVGLANVDNTADSAKPISTATQTALDGKEPTISSGTTAQYWRGDKTWRDFATDVRAAVLTGLSTATATAVAATDSVLVAIGKLQAQASAVRSIALGGTGASDAAGARSALGVAQDGPKFRVSNTTAPGLSNSTFTKVPLNSEQFDSTGAFDSTTNYRFQPAVAGYYDVKFAIGLTSSSSALQLAIAALYKNGVEYSRIHQVVPPVNLSQVASGDVVYLNGSTDYIELWAYATVTSGGPGVQGSAVFTYMAGHYIGA